MTFDLAVGRQVAIMTTSPPPSPGSRPTLVTVDIVVPGTLLVLAVGFWVGHVRWCIVYTACFAMGYLLAIVLLLSVISFYTVAGGLAAVELHTDAVQTAIMLAAGAHPHGLGKSNLTPHTAASHHKLFMSPYNDPSNFEALAEVVEAGTGWSGRQRPSLPSPRLTSTQGELPHSTLSTYSETQ
ncbi:sodium/myo-inositol cotransporter 2-like protein [Lates japonicus]|uniref:Sodium/myo-inositol cotransporter 2-like protein n=1 Tax=Lates japonicus TaxID=270547 RepID=A0AAD3N5H3_LATJO|nr:sodium/myo-inositol cotransporter 2-like protein [Lates japonicus]